MNKQFQKILNEDPRESMKRIGKIIMNKAFRISLPFNYFTDPDIYETDLSSLTPQDIIDKMKEFLDSNPKDEAYGPFIFYLTHFPVSMCKRSVSLKLKFLIGFHYGFGVPQKKHENTIQNVSMEELAEIFGRSKATIHECIKATEKDFKVFQEEVKKAIEIDTKADRELIEERKAQLRREKSLETTP